MLGIPCLRRILFAAVTRSRSRSSHVEATSSCILNISLISLSPEEFEIVISTETMGGTHVKGSKGNDVKVGCSGINESQDQLCDHQTGWENSENANRSLLKGEVDSRRGPRGGMITEREQLGE